MLNYFPRYYHCVFCFLIDAEGAGNSDNVIIFLWFQHLEAVIRARIPSITSLINKSIDELESEMDHLGRPIAVDAGVGHSYLLFF